MKESMLGFVLILSSLVVGCAHYHPVQSFESKAQIPDGVKVGIGNSEVKQGDFVDLLKQTCRDAYAARGGRKTVCSRTKVGEAKVLAVLDEKSAIIEAPQGLSIETNMLVEKKEEGSNK